MAKEQSRGCGTSQALCRAAQEDLLASGGWAITACQCADVSLGLGGCPFLWGMQKLQTLSLARTRLQHDSLAAVLGNLTLLTSLNLGWCAPLFLSLSELCGDAPHEAVPGVVWRNGCSAWQPRISLPHLA
jgi:hypothetical protein